MTDETTRRGFLTTAGSAVTAATLSTGSASASHNTTVPDHVSVSYEPAVIREYMPSLVLDGVDPSPDAYHAAVVRSAEYTTDCVVGAVKYPYQDGRTQLDSHLGDREWFYTFYDDQTGDITHANYTVWHWYKGRVTPDLLQFDDGNPVFEVDDRYHHYRVYSGAAAPETLPVEDLTESLSGWLSNGLESELAPHQPWNPWRMRGRESWWKHSWENYFDASAAAWKYKLGWVDTTVDQEHATISTW